MKVSIFAGILISLLGLFFACMSDPYSSDMPHYDPYELIDMGWAFEKQDHSDSMIWAFEQAYHLLDQVYQSQQEDSVLLRLMTIQGVLSSMYQKQSAEKLADSVLSLAIQQGTKTFGMHGHEMANTYKKLGELRMMQQKFPEADSLLALSVQLYRHGPDSISGNLARALSSQATSFMNGGKYADALPILKEAKELLTLLDNQKSLAFALSKLGFAYYHLYHFDTAELYLLQSQKVLEHIYGPDHSYVYNGKEFLGVTYVQSNQLRKADTVLSDLLNFRKASRDLGPEHILTGNVYGQLGWNYYRLEEYDKALEYLTEHIRITILNHGDSARNLHKAYSNLASVYSTIGQSTKAHYYFNLAINNAVLYFKDNDLDLQSLYYSYGVFCLRQHDHALAESFLQRSLDILEDYRGRIHPLRFVDPLLNLGDAFASQSREEEALIVQKEAIFLAKPHIHEYPRYLAQSYLHIAETYLQMEQLDSSHYYFREAEAMFTKLNIQPTLSTLQNNYSWLLQKQDNFKKAESYMREVQAYKARSVGKHHPQYARTYNRLAEIAQEAGQQEQALYWSDSALIILNNIPQTLLNREAQVEKNRSHIIRLHSGLLDTSAFEGTYQELLQIMDQIQAAFGQVESKEQFQAQNVPLYEEIIHYLVEQYEQNPLSSWAETSFLVSEKTMAYSLRQQLQQLDPSLFPQLDPSVAELEDQLQDSLLVLDAMFFSRNEKIKRDRLEQRIFSVRRRLDSLLLHIQEIYPTYHQARYSSKVSSVSDVQSSLTDDTGLLSYFLGSDHSFAWYLTPEGITVRRMAHPDSIRQWIRSYHIHSNQNPTGELSDSLRLASFRLFQELIAPFGPMAPRLILIPMDELSSISFESLLTEYKKQTEIKVQSFFLEDHAISYSYSASIYDILRRKKSFSRKGALIMAPVFDKSNGTLPLASLRFSEIEAQTTHENIGGTLFLGQSASKAQFLAQASNPSIIHLATHGKMEPTEIHASNIYFADDSLSLAEMYTLELQAQLFVLNACETAKGSYRTGEGVISLAQACMYAGAQSMITNLDVIQDGVSQTLMQHFYEYLMNGTPKDVALQQAKLTFLKESNPAMLTPKTWDQMILIGDNRPLERRESWLDLFD